MLAHINNTQLIVSGAENGEIIVWDFEIGSKIR